MDNGILILTQDHSAIYSVKNIWLSRDGDSQTADLYAEVNCNGICTAMRVAQYKKRSIAREMLGRIAEKSRIHEGEIIDLAYEFPYTC